MRYVSTTVAVLVLLLGLAGCTESPEPVVSTNESVPPDASMPVEVVASNSTTVTPAVQDMPADAVSRFYEALRVGDDARIAGLLTDKARASSAAFHV